MMKSIRQVKELLISALAFATVFSLFLCGCSGFVSGANNEDSTNVEALMGNTLSGTGSSFVYPLFSKMFSEYSDATGIKISYQSVGSEGDTLRVIGKTVDFRNTEVPLNAAQSEEADAAILHIPVAAGAEVVSYNLPGLRDTLKLIPELIADLFLGRIKTWNDPAIADINPGVNLPALPVIIIHRSDGNSATFVWTDYLSKISPIWKARVGKGTAVNWPIGLGGKDNEGVSELLKQTPGGIGYVELAYAIQNKMPVAKIKNKSGNFIYPGFSSISAAGDIQIPGDAEVSITNTDVPDGYPISSFTWMIIYREQKYNNRSQAKAQQLLKLMWWMIHGGQVYCKPLDYAPLALPELRVAESVLRSVTYDGAIVLQ